ncbi:hypothetical protein [Streptomyces sp. SDr-06]|uniref:hypothetical protein n=1 Tax=Streptomyces sp. SDr-06 TaxID=2267702 RepID=UPI00167A1D7E|nr:hypothetical protein [Streptomyces sp. SDr-06]
MSAVAAAAVLIPGPREAAAVSSDAVPSGDRRVRRQRVRVPMRLVWSAFYEDVALSVYVKVKALAARPEGCQAKAVTIASYLGLSKASVERGLKVLSHPAQDGVTELESERRTLPGGRGTSAVRRTRPMDRTEAFVWVPVAAAEDLTPRQLRVYALVSYAQALGVGLTEAELASYLLHRSGKKAGQALSVTAASAVVDAVEAARWMTVRRRAGERGRHVYVAHDLRGAETGPDVAAGGCSAVVKPSEAAVPSSCAGAASSQVGEGSGSPVDEGSLAKRESPRTDSPDDEGAFFPSAVGEVPVVEAGESPADAAAHPDAHGGLALRADENNQPAPTKPNGAQRSSGKGPTRPSYTGPQLSMRPQIYAVLEPVRWLLERVNNPFVERQIVREVGRQLDAGMDAERLYHRLTARTAGTLPSEIRDPGRWLLGVALPRWGCGHFDCESGVRWSNGERCAVCQEIVADKFAAQRLEQGLCPDRGTPPGLDGSCAACQLDDASCIPAPAPAARQPEGPPRGSCGDCGCRILLTGRALEDGLCKLCREEAAALASAPTVPAASVGPFAPDSERRTAFAQQLHKTVTAEAGVKARRWERIREQQAAATKTRAEAAAAQPADIVADEPVPPVVLPAPRAAAVIAPAPQPEPADLSGEQELVLEDLTREQVLDWRNRAAAEPLDPVVGQVAARVQQLPWQ